MANARTCVLLFVLLVNYRLVLSQPTFGSAIFCSLFCDDSDESGDDDDYDYDIFGFCSSCSSKDSESDTAGITTTEKPNSQPVKIMIPPSSGMNLTIFSNLGNGILMDLVPWLAPAGTAAPAAAATAPAAATTVAGNSSEATTAKPK